MDTTAIGQRRPFGPRIGALCCAGLTSRRRLLCVCVSPCSYPLLTVTDIACSMFVTEYPPCDCNEEHTAVIHCPACEGTNTQQRSGSENRECKRPRRQRTRIAHFPRHLSASSLWPAENFCSECDVMIHARKKNKDHTREPIELQAEQEPEPEPEVEQEPVPCDSDPSHVAVMYCEDCEENFCGSVRKRAQGQEHIHACLRPRSLAHVLVFVSSWSSDCDYAFHSRKKTANHSRFEGARRPEDIEALKREAELEAQAAAAAGGAAPAPQNATSAPAGSAATSYAAVAAAGGASAAAAPTAAASAASPSSAASSPASATDPAAGGKKPKKTKETSAQRVAEHKAAWDERRKALCKSKYNGATHTHSCRRPSKIHAGAFVLSSAFRLLNCAWFACLLFPPPCVLSRFSGSLVGSDH